MPPISSGLVSARTSMTGFPLAAISSACLAVKAIRPDAAPGPAGSPRAMIRPCLCARTISLESKIGASSWITMSGSMRRTTSSREIFRAS